MRTISIGETGPDWEPTPATRYYAQRESTTEIGWGATEREAFEDLMKKELHND